VRYPYPGGVGVPQLGRPCRSRSLLLVIKISLPTQSKGTKVVLAENFFKESFRRRGGSSFLDSEATAQAGTLAEGLAVAVGSAWSAPAKASQQRAQAEGMFCPFCDFVFVSILLLASKECCPTTCRVRDGS
jgi:hypothetical protein